MNIPKPVVQVATNVALSAIGTLTSMAIAALVTRATDTVAAERRKAAADHLASLEAQVEELKATIAKNEVGAWHTGEALKHTLERLAQAVDERDTARTALATAGLSTSTAVALRAA